MVGLAVHCPFVPSCWESTWFQEWSRQVKQAASTTHVRLSSHVSLKRCKRGKSTYSRSWSLWLRFWFLQLRLGWQLFWLQPVVLLDK